MPDTGSFLFNREEATFDIGKVAGGGDWPLYATAWAKKHSFQLFDLNEPDICKQPSFHQWPDDSSNHKCGAKNAFKSAPLKGNTNLVPGR
jgi:hypothetical protein